MCAYLLQTFNIGSLTPKGNAAQKIMAHPMNPIQPFPISALQHYMKSFEFVSLHSIL